MINLQKKVYATTYAGFWGDSYLKTPFERKIPRPQQARTENSVVKETDGRFTQQAQQWDLPVDQFPSKNRSKKRLKRYY